MLGYLSKFVLQMLPTISATVIGAYIVATWINPKTPPDPAKIAAKAQAQQSANVKGKPTAKAPPATDLPAPEVAAAPVEPKAVEPAVETATPAENAKPVKAAAADSIRVIPIVKQAPAARHRSQYPLPKPQRLSMSARTRPNWPVPRSSVCVEALTRCALPMNS